MARRQVALRGSGGGSGDSVLRDQAGTLESGQGKGLARLDAFVAADPSRYLPLADEALRLAAELWAKTRREGKPTSPASDLDIDVILAAQALTLNVGSEVTVVTTNPRHLRPFVDAQLWSEIE